MIRATRNNQRGFTLVELMVAMVVSLLMLLAIVQILLGNKDSYRTQNELATLNQDARLARFIIENSVAHAGYIDETDLDSDPVHLFTDGFISDDANGTAANSDTLTVRFQSDGAMNNCLGHPVPKVDTALFQIYVDTENELTCAYDSDGDGDIDQTQPLLSNAVLMKVRFGLDSDPEDGRPGVDSYANTITNATRDQVRSVRVQLILKSESELRTTPLTTHFDIAGTDTDFDPEDDYHAYLMVDQVTALRNLLP